eukprot:3156560-Amphidinium_carterae.1
MRTAGNIGPCPQPPPGNRALTLGLRMSFHSIVGHTTRARSNCSKALLGSCEVAGGVDSAVARSSYSEFIAIKEYLGGGGSVFILLGEGGEGKYETNVNYLIEDFAATLLQRTLAAFQWGTPYIIQYLQALVSTSTSRLGGWTKHTLAGALCCENCRTT